MSSLQVPPQNLMQREILSVVEKLRNSDLSPYTIYEIICSRFPMMEDSDIYFLDLLLGCEHLGRKKAGNCIVSDLRICLGKDEDDFYDGLGAKSFFVRHTRNQFCDNDMFSEGRDFVAAAVKLVNPLYGTDSSTAEFDLVLEVKSDEDKKAAQVYREECEFTLNQFEYTHIEYIAITDLFSIKELKEIDLGCVKMYLRLCRKGTEQTIMCREFDYVDMGLSIAPNFRLLSDGSELYFTDNMTANLSLQVESLIPLDNFWLPKMQIGVRVETFGEQMPRTVYFNHIELDRHVDNIYVYMGKLFGELWAYNGILFEEGEYRVFFTYMEAELFHTKITCTSDQIYIGHSGNTFIADPELGKNRPETDDEPAQDDAQDDDSDDDFDRLLDDFVSKMNNSNACSADDADDDSDDDSDDERGRKMEVTGVSMCSAEGLDRLFIPQREFFFMRSPDKYLHLAVFANVEGNYSSDMDVDNVEVECGCSASGRRKFFIHNGIVEDGILYCTVPLHDVYPMPINPGEKLVFEVVVRQFGQEIFREEIAGFAIRHIFDVVSLESIDLLNTSDEDNASEALPMTGFKHGDLKSLTAMFSITAPREFENLHLWLYCNVKRPDGVAWAVGVDRIQSRESDLGDKFTAFYSTQFDNLDYDDWIRGRYELKFSFTDAKDVWVDLAKVYFSVGDWNDEGVYDADVVARQMGRRVK